MSRSPPGWVCRERPSLGRGPAGCGRGLGAGGRWGAKRGALLALALLSHCRESEPSVGPRSDDPRRRQSPSAAGSIAAPDGLPGSSPLAGVRLRRGAVPGRSDWRFVELALDLRRVRLSLRMPASAGRPMEAKLPPGALAMINGGYFDEEYRPTSWLRSGGRDLSRRRRSRRGGVLLIRGAAAYIGPNWDLPFEPELALQSGPLVVEPDARPGIRADDGQRAARTLVCGGGDRIRFILLRAPVGDGPTLFEAMKLLQAPRPQGFACRVALNLDGGPSAGMWLSESLGGEDLSPLAPIAYAVVVFPALGRASGAP